MSELYSSKQPHGTMLCKKQETVLWLWGELYGSKQKHSTTACEKQRAIKLNNEAMQPHQTTNTLRCTNLMYWTTRHYIDILDSCNFETLNWLKEIGSESLWFNMTRREEVKARMVGG